jgi:hypothetical protein
MALLIEFLVLMFVWGATALVTSGVGLNFFAIILIISASMTGLPVVIYFIFTSAYASRFSYLKSMIFFLGALVFGSLGYWAFIYSRSGIVLPANEAQADIVVRHFLPFLMVAGAAFIGHLYRMQPDPVEDKSNESSSTT